MRVVVGRIGRAHGVRGEVTVEVRTDEPEERFAAGSVLLCTGRAGVPARVTVGGRSLAQRPAGGAPRRRRRTATAAEALRGTLLEADVDPAVGEDDEFHDHVLVGLEVRDRGGQVLGTVSEVMHLPAQDLLAVAGPDGPSCWCPFVTEFVPEVDVRGRSAGRRCPTGWMSWAVRTESPGTSSVT